MVYSLSKVGYVIFVCDFIKNNKRIKNINEPENKSNRFGMDWDYNVSRRSFFFFY